MPHVIVKMAAGRSDADKTRLAERIALALSNTIGVADSTISVAIEDVDPKDWMKEVFEPDIAAQPDTLFKKPGYAAV
ncbi:tautomerase family protein [Tropicibacter naphthalenivorans]|uniref:Tautomerase PptA n=1 Tax=Tropicibacter naphthalenivorans TaxID=441103 RepID=A0A0P1GHX7_9RHOB|nr:tautomerase family protein [Tropicibacter naphthalenivorans]CUH81342.1 Tautomerase PptA [Tropicibacter naphthalenivorans]SMC98456.1 4-oxalocrotonate tautomerase [Tropicibacter naphthalenivorans]